MTAGGVGFLLQGCVDSLRSYVDYPGEGSRFDDSWLLEHEIGTSIPDVLHRIRNWDSGTLILTHEFDGVKGQKFYRLPCCVKEVVRLEILDQQDEPIVQLFPRSADDPYGFGYKISQEYLEFRDPPKGSEKFRVSFTYGGGSSLHQGTGTLSGGTEFTLDPNPELGKIDRREGAYLGHVLRIVPGGSGPIEEQTIVDHEWDGSNWKVTLRSGFENVPDGNAPYEIVPWGIPQFWECVAARAAMRLGSKISITTKDRKALNAEYATLLKTAVESHEFRQNRRNARLETFGQSANAIERGPFPP